MGKTDKKISMKKKHIGENFDEFLKEESLLEHCTAIATDRILAWKTERETGERTLSKTSTTKNISATRIAQKN
jgi:hypothetical protein